MTSSVVEKNSTFVERQTFKSTELSIGWYHLRVNEAHRLVELDSLVHLPRKAVDEEATLAIGPALNTLALLLFQRLLHRVLEKLDSDLHRHDRAFPNARSDELAVLRSFTVLLGTEEVTSYERGCALALGVV